ncbi:MAG: type IV pilus modification protein PilV [Psychrosphaera sp.]|jgi:type IV pilus modification protein PilV
MQYSKMEFAARKLTQGSSLIEVLVALIIFSIGMLGIVGVQLSHTRSAQITNQFIQANLIVTNLANRLILNKQHIFTTQTQGLSHSYFFPESYDFAQLGGCQGSHYQCFCLEPPINITNCRTTTNLNISLCNNTQVALFDIYEVSCMLALMSNDATISIHPTVLNTTSVLLEIDLIWPSLSSPQTTKSSGCQQTLQALNKAVTRYVCYSQQLVLTEATYES